MTVRTKLRIGLAAVAAVALAALPACSGGTASQDGPIDLRMTIWSSNVKHLALFNAIGEAYVAANPDTVSSIKFDTLTNDYVSSLTTQVAGNDVPDLVWVAEANSPFGVYVNATLIAAAGQPNPAGLPAKAHGPGTRP